MKDKKSQSISRRDFLNMTWVATVLGLFGQASIALFNFLKPRIEEGGFGSKVIAGQIEEFTPGTVSRVQKGRFYISRLEDGGVLALWQRCTHLGCTVPWSDEQKVFHCPCHSSVFTPEGDVISGPAPRPMDIFPVEIIDGVLVIDTGAPIQRDKFIPSQATQV